MKLHAKQIVVLCVCCLLGQAACLAQDAPTGRIQQSLEMLEKEKTLRTRIAEEKKFFIKKIIVGGNAVLPGDEIEEIISSYRKHWLSKADFESMVALLQDACIKSGYDALSLKITYRINGSTLKITIQVQPAPAKN